MQLILFLTTVFYQLITTYATGQGVIGIHAINDRYVLVADSNILSLVVVDVLLGGVAGILTFPTSLYNNETKRGADIHFISVTSCDTCLYIHVDKMHWNFPNSTEEHVLEIGPLERPLLEMAKDSNFTAFNSLSFERDVQPVWPFPREYLNEKNSHDMRMLRSHPSGGVGFLARQQIGILRYQLDPRGKMIHYKGEVFFRSKDKITGINFSSTYKRLVAAGKTKAYVFDITEENASINDTKREEISLTESCMNGRYRNSVLWDDDDPTSQIMIVDGHDGNGMKGGVGVVLQKLTRDIGNNDTWDCEIVAGDPNDKVGWRDGCETSSVRFTRPHDMIILPESSKLVVTDIDNRAIRLVEPPSLTNKSVICVSSVSYDEGLYMKIFVPHSPQEEEDTDDKGSSEGEEKHNEEDVSHEDDIVNSNVLKEQIVAASEEASQFRAPFILYQEPTQVCKMSFDSARDHCQSSSERENSDICTLEEVRTLFYYDGKDHDALRTAFLSNPFWTKQSCKGCWKRRKGICTDKDPSWENDYHMVAVGLNLDLQSPNERGLRTQCIRDDETMTPLFQCIHLLCCGSRKYSNDGFKNTLSNNSKEKIIGGTIEEPALLFFWVAVSVLCLLFFVVVPLYVSYLRVT